MNKFRISKKTATKVLTVAVVLLAVTPMFAQNASVANAAADIKKYWVPVKTLIYAIGGVVGLIGGVRIYNKWTNGDQDINKEIVGWGGACLFLTVVPTFVSAFFEV